MEPKRTTPEDGKAGGSGESNGLAPAIGSEAQLNKLLKKAGRVSTKNKSRDVDAMSVLSSGIPLAPSRVEYSDVSYSTQFNRTLMIGRDVLEPVDIFGLEIYNSYSAILRNSQIEQLNSLQRSTWPHILRGRDCTIIGGTNPHKGKSISYLTPLAHVSSKMVETFRKEEKEGLIGPVGLIVCGSSRSCHKVNGMLTKLIQGTRINTHVVQNHFDKESKRRLSATTEFVVTTPRGALSLFAEYFETFKFERLRYFVLDDTQHTFLNYMPEIQDLVGKIQTFRSNMRTQRPLQTILCGTEWNDSMASATIKVCNDAVLLLESSMAALLYGTIDIRVHFFAQLAEKLEAVCEICEGFSPTSRSIIVCNDPDTLRNVKVKLFRCSNIDTYGFADDEENIVAKTRNLKSHWKTWRPGKKLVIVVSDAVLKDSRDVITDAHNIIHYELPLKKKEAFADRHMSMWHHFPAISDYHTSGDDALKSKVPLKSHVFLTSGDAEMHKIVLKLHSIQVPIPEQLLEYAKKEGEKLVLEKTICSDFKLFGKCISSDPCTLRHYFTNEEVTQESTLPKHGRIQVELLKMKDVNCYTAKLLSYYDVVQDKKKDFIRFANLEKKIKEAMNAFYSCEDNRVVCEDLQVGEYCAALDQDKLYRRCQVTRLFSIDQKTDEPMYRVFQIDVGDYLLRRQSELSVLPNELTVASKKQIIVDLYLAGIKPLGIESGFSNTARSGASGMTANNIFTGKIALSLGNDVWVSSLVEHKRGHHDEWIQVRSLRVDFIKKFNYGEDNPKHMELLYQSCESASGLNYDRYRAVEIIGRDLATIFFQKGERVEWAFLPNYSHTGNRCPTVSVWCSVFKSLGEIYVQREDTIVLLEKLIEELDQDITTMISDKYTKYATIFEEYYEVGLPVAAFESGGKWNRAMILDKFTTEDEVLFDIFFVDYGDTVEGMSMKDMFPLRSTFVSKLPFQAIQIKCAHIAPLDTNFDAVENWPLTFDSAVDDLVTPYFISDEMSMQLEISTTEKHGSLKVFGTPLCKVYDALIMDTKNGKDIAELVVKNNMAKYAPGAEERVQLWKDTMLDYWNKVVDEATKQDGDTDDEQDGLFLGDDEDFDVWLGFDTVADADKAEMVKKVLADFGVGEVIANPSESKPEVSPRQKAIAGTSAGASGSVSGWHKETNSQAGETIHQNSVPTGPILKKPKVEWRQTPEHILIWVHIPDMTQYSVKLEVDLPDHSLFFESQSPDGYGFQLDFVGRVLSPIEESLNGQYLTLKIRKLSAKKKWPYLLAGNPKLHWLKRRLDEKALADNKKEGYETTDDKEPNKPECSNGEMNRNSTDINYHHPPIDDSDSDDDKVDFSDDLCSDGDDELN